jgi:diguanylate cyclase (GGDEF)-like protein
MESDRPEAPEASDHETFRASIAELDRIVKNSCRATALQITVIVAAIAAPLVFAGPRDSTHLNVASVAYGALALILAMQIRDLFRHGRTARVRERLAKQLKAAVMQKIRANKLYDLSILDPLTGLHNRRFGEERLSEEVARSERNGDPLALLLFDLDYFKEINDQHGHAAGDAALKEFSRKLKKAIRACDVPVRIGGDEFLVILPECPREKVDTILQRIGSPELRWNGRTIAVRYSIGRAHHQVCDTKESMMQRADEILYAAKAARPAKRETAGGLEPRFNLEESIVFQPSPKLELEN